MEVYLYRADGSRGTVYDFSFNPLVDYEILKKTRRIDNFEVLGLMDIDKAKESIENMYSTRLFDKIFKISGKRTIPMLQKQSIEMWKRRLKEGYNLPSKKDVELVEGAIVGKILTFRELVEFAKQNFIQYETLLDIVQMLYCERRIQISPAFLENKGKPQCYFCKRKPCEMCLFGFKQDDVLLYAADNYNYLMLNDFSYKKPSLNLIEEEASQEILKFTKSKKVSSIIFSAPHSFSIKMLFSSFAEVFKRGGRVLYVTSFNEINEVYTILSNTFTKKRIGIANKNIEDYRNFDIVIAYKSNLIRFYKSFDLVVLNDLNSAFEENIDFGYVVKRSAKDKAKFIYISANPLRNKEHFNELIYIPFAHGSHLISEPRVETARFLSEFEVFVPQMAVDVLKFSIKEGTKTVIFYPDESRHQEILNFLVSCGIDMDLIEKDIKYDDFARALRSSKNVFITSDIRCSRQLVEDINVIVLNAHSNYFNAEKLIYISAMASTGRNKRIGEVLFVAENETEEISLARKCIRSLNKVSWEKEYVKL
ncbi:hypothetical protein ABG79_00519 [Caloramator mitchellensis]|uniref:Uncharacterized protein n=1 Tax=Caloramator mitchellensis TaxID=908809 RepID=A0A0R3K3S7_CALMK|nr:hypothetical protein [Caloramator mitchellensis]KRQ87717.1 hypothetical protein ABG79_00519 [Caloramator mitchellensis]